MFNLENIFKYLYSPYFTSQQKKNKVLTSFFLIICNNTFTGAISITFLINYDLVSSLLPIILRLALPRLLEQALNGSRLDLFR